LFFLIRRIFTAGFCVTGAIGYGLPYIRSWLAVLDMKMTNDLQFTEVNVSCGELKNVAALGTQTATANRHRL
jgi:hypothetical protein